MKKSILKTLVFTLFLFSTEKVISQNSEIEFSDLKTTDEIFKIKNTVTENNSIDFLKHFYVVSLAENISKNEELTSALTYALGNIIKSELNFSCIALNSKKVFNFLKKSKSKNEIIEEIEKNNFENFTYLELIGVTNDIKHYKKAVKSNILVCDSEPLLFTSHNGNFNGRNGGAFGWIFKSFGITTGIFLIVILFSGYKPKSKKAKKTKPKSWQETFKKDYFFV